MFRPNDAVKRILSGMSLINLSTALVALAIAVGFSLSGCGPVSPSISKFAAKTNAPGSGTSKFSDIDTDNNDPIGITAIKSASLEDTNTASSADKNSLQTTHFIDIHNREIVEQNRKELKILGFKLRAGQVQEFSQRATVKFTSKDFENFRSFKGKEIQFLSAPLKVSNKEKKSDQYHVNINVFVDDAGQTIPTLQNEVRLGLNFSGDEWELKIASPTTSNPNELAAIDAEKKIEILKDQVRAISIEFSRE